MRKNVTTEDLDFAIAWLECNEDLGREGQALKRVAAMLTKLANKRDDKKKNA